MRLSRLSLSFLALMLAWVMPAGDAGAVKLNVGTGRVLLMGKAAASTPPPVDNPAVDANFAANTITGCATLTGCLSVTRSTQETCEGPGLSVTYAAANTPCRTSYGLQVYQAGTNLVAQSQATTGWTTTNVTLAQGAMAPDGTSTAITMTDNSTNNVHDANSAAFTTVVGQVYVFSIYGRMGTCAGAGLECDIAGVSPAFGGGGTFVNVRWSTCQIIGGNSLIQGVPIAVPLANGYCHVYFRAAAVATTTVIGVSMVNAILGASNSGGSKNNTYVGSGSTMLFWGADVKLGTQYLPYCPTAGASATCNADVITAGGADTTLKTALEGAALRIVAKLACVNGGLSAANPVLGVGTALTGIGIAKGWQAQTSWPATATLKTAGQALQAGSGQFNYVGISADASGRSLAINGQTAAGDSNGLSATTTEYIGSLSDASAFLNCTIAELKVWSSRNDAAMLTATANAAALPLVASYTGQIGTRSRIPGALLAPATATQAMSVTRGVWSENSTSYQPRLPNYYVQNNSTETEIGPGAASTVTASLEYPLGSCTQILFSGSSTGTIPDAGTLLPDALSINTVAGDIFKLRVYRTNPNGIVNTTMLMDTANGEGVHYGTTGITDQTVSCDAVTNTSANVFYGADAHLGPTRRQAYCSIEDSRGLGTDDAQTNFFDLQGQSERWIAPNYNFLNMGVGGDQAQKFIASNTNRLPLLAYCTGMNVVLGVNDVNIASRTAVQVEGNLQTIYGYKTNLHGGNGPVWAGTVMGVTTSSDTWTTTSGQTATAGSGTAITPLNTWITANTAGVTGFFDLAAPVSASTNIWCANGITVRGCTFDGLHAVTFGYLSIRNAIGFPTLQ